jgi:acylphosphatase
MDDIDRARQLAPPPLGWMPGDSLASGRSIRARRAAAQERHFLPTTDPRPSSPSERWRLSVRGQVQGVGYRAACSRQAKELTLGGWVRNLPDGSVELEVEGHPQQLAEMRLWCERGPAAAMVNSVSATPLPATGADWFEIRR